MHRRLLFAESPKMAALIEQAVELINSAAFTPVKSEGKTRAGFLACPGHSVVFIKRTDVRSTLARFVDFVAGSRASRAIRGARIIRDAGFNCARPLAAMDVIDGITVRASYLMSEALENAQ